MSFQYEVLIIVVIFLVGLCFGSFMNVLVYRVPRGKNIATSGSHCINCNHPIKWYHNIPLFSYLFLRGKCAFCGVKISPRYPIIEAVTGVLFLLVYLKTGIGLDLFKYLVFVFVCLVCAFTDIDTAIDKDNFETGVIPMVYPFFGIAVGLIISAVQGHFIDSLSGSAGGFLILMFPATIYSFIRKREGMGEGDFYLFGMIGAFTGLNSIPGILTVSALAGVVIGIVIIAVTKDKRYAMPFAPMLCFGGIIYFFFDNYLSIGGVNFIGK